MVVIIAPKIYESLYLKLFLKKAINSLFLYISVIAVPIMATILNKNNIFHIQLKIFPFFSLIILKSTLTSDFANTSSSLVFSSPYSFSNPALFKEFIRSFISRAT